MLFEDSTEEESRDDDEERPNLCDCSQSTNSHKTKVRSLRSSSMTVENCFAALWSDGGFHVLPVLLSWEGGGTCPDSIGSSKVVDDSNLEESSATEESALTLDAAR